MLVVFDSFDDFFAILCSVIRKVHQRRKNGPMMIANIGGIRTSCLGRNSLKSLCRSTTDVWLKPPH